ncbi:DUF4345 domain-containing protein [Thalassotalea sp. HSM 43]|uniref:DUF4345 family protein n=1 Tax=Thalassotalea sp. HSM 43 TaxID=2552945 RepID=UPI00108046EB|nr:DUF4345 family protein [Thalassotalea sp. HSM 43]QBY05435.1 DUF4345 domain-containing protein [Thalassotalea sp. HSM 43]
MALDKAFVMVMALAFLLFAVAFILAPEYALTLTTGQTLTSATAIVDLRATYGGLSLAIAILLFWLLAKQQLLPIALIAVLTLMLAMAATRLIGLLLMPDAAIIMYVYFILEVAAVLTASWLLRRNKARALGADKQ